MFYLTFTYENNLTVCFSPESFIALTLTYRFLVFNLFLNRIWKFKVLLSDKQYQNLQEIVRNATSQALTSDDGTEKAGSGAQSSLP